MVETDWRTPTYTAPQAWVYKMLSMKTIRDKGGPDFLDQLGGEGWEAVGFSPGNTLLFKRPSGQPIKR